MLMTRKGLFHYSKKVFIIKRALKSGLALTLTDGIEYILPIWYCIIYVEVYALCIMQYAFKITAYHGGFDPKAMHY
jgi:hypothetical protein